MHKTGVLILILFVLGVLANCVKEEGDPAEAKQEVVAGSSEAAAAKQGTDGTESSEAGKPRILFDQKDFDFGQVESGEKVEHVFTFRNTGNGTLTIEKVRSG